MARDDTPGHPNTPGERRKQASRIAEISHRITDMGNAVTSAVRGIGDQLSALHNQIQANDQTTDARETKYYNSSRFWIKIGTISAIIFAVVGLITTFASLYILNNQLKSDRIERRAWVKVELESVQFNKNMPLIAKLIIKNTGKTPARNISSQFIVQNIGKDVSPQLEFKGTIFNLSAGILNPEGTANATVPMLRDAHKPPLLTEAEVSALQNGEAYVAVFGKVEYIDIYDIPHWHNFCFWPHNETKPGSYASKKCVEYNKIDNN